MQVLKGRLAREDIPEPIAREEELVALLHTADAYLWGGEGAVVSTCMLGDGGREAGRHLSCLERTSGEAETRSAVMGMPAASEASYLKSRSPRERATAKICSTRPWATQPPCGERRRASW
jgi:hypothetical protein